METCRQVAISILQIEIYKLIHFPAGTTSSVKIAWGCVIMVVCHGGNPYLIDYNQCKSEEIGLVLFSARECIYAVGNQRNK